MYLPDGFFTIMCRMKLLNRLRDELRKQYNEYETPVRERSRENARLTLQGMGLGDKVQPTVSSLRCQSEGTLGLLLRNIGAHLPPHVVLATLCRHS